MNDFEKLVYEMRSAQKEYFRTRCNAYLLHSKQLEKRVDEYLREKKNKQQNTDHKIHRFSQRVRTGTSKER